MMTHKDKELVFALRKCWAKHPELLLAATRIEKLNAKVEEWRTRHDNLLQSALGKTREDAVHIEAQAREIERLREDGRFLLQMLDDHEVRMTSETDAREFYGHVTPAMARFRAALEGTSHDPAPVALG